MKINTFRKNILIHKTSCLAIGKFEGRGEDGIIEEIDHALDGMISEVISKGDFKGKSNQTVVLYTNGKVAAERILMVGLGKRKDFSIDKLREAAGTAVTAVKKMGVSKLSTTLHILPSEMFNPAELGQAVAEGALLSNYSFDELKTDKEEKKNKLRTLSLVLPLNHKGMKELKAGSARGEKISEGVCFARDLISRPGNVVTPSYLADAAKKMAGGSDVNVTVIDKRGMEELGMGALLGVAKGSKQPPKLIIAEYKGAAEKDERPYVIVGKAITFDSGGISLKPSAAMHEMKMDMSGGAAALGAIKVAEALKIPRNVIAIVPSAENLPSGEACKPGDVLTSMSGLTIEVQNTDAEGRLILADALTYAKRCNPKAVVDIATLTGACLIALGTHATGLMGNNEQLKHQLLKAGEETGERLWELPLWEPYKKQIESDIADVKNVGGREAGTITAAAFLEKFASKYHWAHLDIAGTAWSGKDRPYIPKGAAGVGVRLLTRFLENV